MSLNGIKMPKINIKRILKSYSKINIKMNSKYSPLNSNLKWILLNKKNKSVLNAKNHSNKVFILLEVIKISVIIQVNGSVINIWLNSVLPYLGRHYNLLI